MLKFKHSHKYFRFFSLLLVAIMAFSSLGFASAAAAIDTGVTIADAATVARAHAAALRTPIPSYTPLRASTQIAPGQIAWVPVGYITNGHTLTINISQQSKRLVVMLYDSYYNTYGDNIVTYGGIPISWYIASSATYQIAIYNDDESTAYVTYNTSIS